jgi:hypothetical protein
MSSKRFRRATFVLVGASTLCIAYLSDWPAVLIGSEIVQVGEGETSYFLQKCRYLSIRGKVFEQAQGEESRWRLEHFPCEFLAR